MNLYNYSVILLTSFARRFTINKALTLGVDGFYKALKLPCNITSKPALLERSPKVLIA